MEVERATSSAGHTLEPTAYSATETVADDHHHRERSRTMTNDYGIVFEEFGRTTASPQGTFTRPVYDKPLPQPRVTLDPHSCPPEIPPNDPTRARTLVLCFDGTGDQFDADNSNIVQLLSLLKKDDKTKQMVYYQAGIGTYVSPKVASPWMSKLRKGWDSMFATSLHAHVMSGYEFLMQNYVTGDRISIFGFSRGAYTARSLAGMLHKVGLLPADNYEQVPFAYKMYTRTDSIGWEQSNEFKKAFCVHVNIDFIGVWDTVDSVGIIPKRLPFTTSNTIVRTFRHAVSLDERRAKFKANLWNRPTPEEEKLGTQDDDRGPSGGIGGSMSKSMASEPDVSLINIRDDLVNLTNKTKKIVQKTRATQDSEQATKQRKQTMRKADSHEVALGTFEKAYSRMGTTPTDIQEVWFAGCHSDVGGGSVSNKTRYSLARISLRWMVRECFKTGTGIMFLSERLHDIGMDGATLYPYVLPRPPPLPVDGHRIRPHPRKEIPIRPHSVLKKLNQPSVVSLRTHPTERIFLSEEEEDRLDALSPIYDQLKIKKGWWILEVIPMQLRYQRGNTQWVTYFAANRARPRFIPKQRTNGVKVHRTVKMRMEAEHDEEEKRLRGKKYEPKAELRVQPNWVD